MTPRRTSTGVFGMNRNTGTPISPAQRLGVDPAQHRRDRLGVPSELLGHLPELRGLVSEHDEVGAIGDRHVRLERLPSELIRERLRTARAAVGHEHRVAPAARECARHVASTDQSDLHIVKSTVAGDGEPATRAGLSSD